MFAVSHLPSAVKSATRPCTPGWHIIYNNQYVIITKYVNDDMRHVSYIVTTYKVMANDILVFPRHLCMAALMPAPAPMRMPARMPTHMFTRIYTRACT